MEYILKVNRLKRYIGVDFGNGGYPYHTSINDAKVFTNKQDAIDYSKVFGSEKWELHILNIDSKHIQDLF